jgi:hypothetical protein
MQDVHAVNRASGIEQITVGNYLIAHARIVGVVGSVPAQPPW